MKFSINRDDDRLVWSTSLWFHISILVQSFVYPSQGALSESLYCEIKIDWQAVTFTVCAQFYTVCCLVKMLLSNHPWEFPKKANHMQHADQTIISSWVQIKLLLLLLWIHLFLFNRLCGNILHFFFFLMDETYNNFTDMYLKEYRVKDKYRNTQRNKIASYSYPDIKYLH